MTISIETTSADKDVPARSSMLAPTSASTPAEPSVDIYAPGMSATRFLIAAIGGAIATAALMALVMALLNRKDLWQGYAVGVIAGVLSAVISAVPVSMLFSRTVPTIMSGFLAAGGLRALTLGGIVVLAVRVGGYPAIPSVLCAAVMYASVVLIEGLTLWNMIDRHAKPIPSNAPGGDGTSTPGR